MKERVLEIWRVSNCFVSGFLKDFGAESMVRHGEEYKLVSLDSPPMSVLGPTLSVCHVLAHQVQAEVLIWEKI